ncbi:hypothetical protein B0H13DRAFT_2357758 [Mycena leptocephala]|nr:hypothetical protein B0H13DRAFT_2357758 [Mycena leptocephala]
MPPTNASSGPALQLCSMVRAPPATSRATRPPPPTVAATRDVQHCCPPSPLPYLRLTLAVTWACALTHGAATSTPAHSPRRPSCPTRTPPSLPQRLSRLHPLHHR